MIFRGAALACVLVLVALLGGAPAPSCAAEGTPVLARLATRVDAPDDPPRVLFARAPRISSVRVQASRVRARLDAKCAGVVPVAARLARSAFLEPDAGDHLRLAGTVRVRPPRGPPAS